MEQNYRWNAKKEEDVEDFCHLQVCKVLETLECNLQVNLYKYQLMSYVPCESNYFTIEIKALQ